MRKRINLFLLPLVIVSLLLISSCSTYHSDPGTKEQISGTYELTAITKKNGIENYDYMALNGIKAYFTVNTDGTGYYVYMDNNTQVTTTPINITFIEDLDEQGLYKSIKLGDGTNVSTWEKEVGCLDEPTMGFDVKKGTLSYTIPHQEPNKLLTHEIMYQYVCYTKISDDCDLSKINSKIGA